MPSAVKMPVGNTTSRAKRSRAIPGGVHIIHIRPLNHIKLPVHDLDRSMAFYTDVLGLTYIPQYDHRDKTGRLFAVMLQLPSSSASSAHHRPSSDLSGAEMLVELRLSARQAAAQRFWDPVTWGVATRAELEGWRVELEARGVRCSRVFTAIKGWVLCALDPDEKIVRIYCDEEHEWTKGFDEDRFWLRMD